MAVAIDPQHACIGPTEIYTPNMLLAMARVSLRVNHGRLEGPGHGQEPTASPRRSTGTRQATRVDVCLLVPMWPLE
jgi:hypothetical protein